MKTKLLLLSAALGLTSALSHGSQLIAYWNQNSNNLSGGGFGFEVGDFPQAADAGVGSATLTVGGGNILETDANDEYTRIKSFAGTTNNALFGDGSGGSIALQGGADNENNGAFIEFSFDMTGYMDLVVSYATQRTNSGFDSQAWSWSTDGSNFTEFQTVTDIPSSFQTRTLNTLTSLNNASTAYLRVTFDGATTTTGNNRMDNIQLNATVIPEPGTLALLGLSGLLLYFRSRRKS